MFCSTNLSCSFFFPARNGFCELAVWHAPFFPIFGQVANYNQFVYGYLAVYDRQAYSIEAVFEP
jgi:hypothetical protein